MPCFNMNDIIFRHCLHVVCHLNESAKLHADFQFADFLHRQRENAWEREIIKRKKTLKSALQWYNLLGDKSAQIKNIHLWIKIRFKNFHENLKFWTEIGHKMGNLQNFMTNQTLTALISFSNILGSYYY